MKIIISFLLLGAFLSTTAQDTKKVKTMPLTVHSIGGSYQKFDGLNSRVAGLPQFKQIKDYTATLGLGWLKEDKGIVTTGTINLGTSMSGNHNEKSSTIRYGTINLDLGYDLVKSDMVLLYPFVGLGFQRYRAIFYKDNSAVDFDNVLQSANVKNSISSVKFNNSFLVYRLGLGFAVQSKKCPGSSIGLQAGYAGSFKNHAWKSNENQTLGNAPVDKVSQVFANIVFTSTPKFMNGKW